MRLPKYKIFIAIIDFVLVFFTLIFSFSKIVSKKNDLTNIFLDENLYILILFILVSVVFIFIQQANNLYKINIFLSRANQTVYLLKSVFLFSLLLVFTSFLLKAIDILASRIFVLTASVLVFSVMFFFRVVLLQKFYRIFAKNNLINKNILIIGAGKAGQFLFKRLNITKGLGIKVVGFLDDYRQIGEEVASGIQVLGDINALKELKKKMNISEVIIAIDNIGYDRIVEILDQCKKLNLLVKVSSDLFDIIPQKIEIEKYNNIPLVNASPQIHSEISLFFKRIIDLLVAILGIVLLSPLLLVVSALILFSSKGPIIYKQIRIGKNGKPFNFYKFRSMRMADAKTEDKRKQAMIDFMKNGKSQNGNNAKVVDEQRITSIGKFIRKTSIDELPQLINVLKGEMSLVGPRPCLPYEYENLEDWQKRRFDVLPGCTGVWQVLGRSEVSFKDSIVLDLYYINNMSPWLDLQLILKTIPVMILSKGGK